MSSINVLMVLLFALVALTAFLSWLVTSIYFENKIMEIIKKQTKEVKHGRRINR